MASASLTPAIGDVVTLISGGPPMTVEKLESGPVPPAGLPPGVGPQLLVHSVWFHPDTGGLARAAFPSDVLVAAGSSPVESAPSSASPAP